MPISPALVYYIQVLCSGHLVPKLEDLSSVKGRVQRRTEQERLWISVFRQISNLAPSRLISPFLSKVKKPTIQHRFAARLDSERRTGSELENKSFGRVVHPEEGSVLVKKSSCRNKLKKARVESSTRVIFYIYIYIYLISKLLYNKPKLVNGRVNQSALPHKCKYSLT